MKSVAIMGPLSLSFPEWICDCVTFFRPSASIWYQTLNHHFTISPVIPVADTSGCGGSAFLPLSIAMYPFCCCAFTWFVDITAAEIDNMAAIVKAVKIVFAYLKKGNRIY
jgi:hypothetical protein